MAAAAISFGASAQDLVPVDMTHTLQNPSFELTDAAVEGDAAHMTGWMQDGELKGQWTGKSQKTMPEGSDGAWYARIVLGSGSMEPGNKVYQFVESSDFNEGVYVLTATVQVSRNSWRGNIDALGCHGYIYIADGDDDPTSADSRGRIKIGECCKTDVDGKGWYQARIVYPSSFTDFGFEIGFGVPAESNGIPKGSFEIDNFKLTYYDTNDVEAVEKAVGKTTKLVGIAGYAAGVDDVIAAPVAEDNKWYNLQGIEIEEPTNAGLYIHNGKKIVIR